MRVYATSLIALLLSGLEHILRFSDSGMLTFPSFSRLTEGASPEFLPGHCTHSPVIQREFTGNASAKEGPK